MFSPEKRSEIMSHIWSKGTQAERLAFSYLRKNKIYFQKHYRRVPGTPDIALPRKKRAVFIDSAFWHGKDYERITKTRKPDDYWVKKIARNIERDKTTREALVAQGWQIMIIWEADIKRKRTRNEAFKQISDFLTQE